MTEPSCEVWLVIDVDLSDDRLSGVLGRHLLDVRRKRLAWPAPGRAEVDDDGVVDCVIRDRTRRIVRLFAASPMDTSCGT